MKQYHYQKAPKKDKLKVEWMYIEAKYFEEPGQLPDQLFEYTNIERLGIRGSLKAFPEDLAEKLPKLKEISIAFLGAEGLPERLGACSALEKIWISVTDGPIVLPSSIQQLTNLKELALVDCKLPTIPVVLTKLPALEHLKLNDNLITSSLPAEQHWQNLQKLDLNNNKLETIPDWVFLQTNLKTLDVSWNKLSQISPKIEQLQALNSFSCYYNNLTDLSPSIAHLPNLRTFFWDNNPFGYVTPVIFQLPLSTITSNQYYRHLGDFSIKNVATIVVAMHKIFTKKAIDTKSSPLVMVTTQLLNQSPLLQEKPITDILDTYVIGNKDIKAFALKEITRRLKPFVKATLDTSSELLILGKTIQTKTAIKASLQPLNITVTNKKTASTTHVLLGKNIKKISVLTATNLVAINEQQLHKFIDTYAPAYLVEESENKAHSTEQIKKLLESFELDNINIALTLMKSGGVPKALITLIFAVHKFSADAKVVRQSKKLLQLNVSATLLEKLKKRFILKHNTQGFHQINNYLDFLCENTEINKLQLTQYAFDFANRAYPYNNIYISTVKELSEEKQLEGLKYFLDNKINQGYIRLESGDQGAVEALYQRKDVTEIVTHPANILEHYYPIAGLENLHQLTLDYAYYPLHLSKDFAQLKNLKVLLLKNIVDFDEEAWQQLYQLPNLSTLHVHTGDMSVPEGILKFPRIKQLKLSGWKLSYDLPISQLQTIEEVIIDSKIDTQQELLFEQLSWLPHLKKVQLPPALQANYQAYLKQKN